MTDADICRVRGWTVGTVLEGDEGYGPDRIVITAIGERELLARQISRNGEPMDGHEGLWTLQFRDWTRVTPCPPPNT